MPDGKQGFFVGDRDFEFFQQVNRELVEDIVNVNVVIYKIAPEQTKSNMYGEAEEGAKVYFPGVGLKALIQPEDQQTEENDFTFDVKRDLTLGFQRERLKDKDLYPQRGDIVEFDNQYYEIKEVVDNTLLASKWFYRHSVVCRCHVARDTNLTLTRPNQ